MADENVSDFLVKSCQLSAQLDMNKMMIWYHNSMRECQVTTGSAAEIYIQPLLPCIGDVDAMGHATSCLVVELSSPELRLETCSLPSTFDDLVRVCKTQPSNPAHPGYVYLTDIGLLKKTSNSGNSYTFFKFNISGQQIPCVRHPVKSLQWKTMHEHGPAVKSEDAVTSEGGHLDVDFVSSVRCLQWPMEAADWPKRPRKWPDRKTVDTVIGFGCDFVPVTHHLSRLNENDRTCQHRFSFSRAEVVLLNSWTPKQQIVYHMLRVVTQAEKLCNVRESTNCRTLSRYHIKTLMLWFSERAQVSWWERFNVVQLCAHMLQALKKRCLDNRCSGYFIPEMNLFECDNSCPGREEHMQQIINSLTRLTERRNLTQWFIKNYITECAQDCPQKDVLKLLHIGILTKAASKKIIEHWENKRLNAESLRRYMTSSVLCINIADKVSKVANLYKAAKQLRPVDEKLVEYFSGVLLLKACGTTELKTDSNTLLLIETVVTNFSDDVKLGGDNNDCSLMFTKALRLMKKSTSSQNETSACLLLSLSHIYLRKILKSSKDKTVRCLANVHLAVLYYITGHYQSALRHCVLVGFQSQDQEGFVEGSVLPKIDDRLDNVLGFIVLYRFIQTAAVGASSHETKQKFEENGFGVQFLAEYIAWKCLTDGDYIKRSRANDCKLVYLADYLCGLYCVLRRTTQRSTKLQTTVFSRSNLRELLVLSAVERLTAFNCFLSQLIRRGELFVTTDIRAMYAYRCRQYKECLRLCRDNINSLWPYYEEYVWDITLTATGSSVMKLTFIPGHSNTGRPYNKHEISRQTTLSDNLTPLMDGHLAGFSALKSLCGYSSKIFSLDHLVLFVYLSVQCRLRLKDCLKSLLNELATVEKMGHRMKETDPNPQAPFLVFVYRILMFAVKRHSYTFLAKQ